VLGIIILSTGHKLLGEAERVPAAAALRGNTAQATAEREFEAEEMAGSLAGDAG